MKTFDANKLIIIKITYKLGSSSINGIVILALLVNIFFMLICKFKINDLNELNK